MRDWPVVVTNRCAEACAEEFGLGHRDGARAWLYKIIQQRGHVTDHLPEPVARLRSGSGYFMVANDVVVLPLVKASDGTARWIATDCKVFPSYRERHSNTAKVDPLRLTGAPLVRQVNFTRRAIERYQQLCDGDPNLDLAREDLRAILSRDARAVGKPPAWCRTDKAEVYLVSADEYVLPLSRNGTAGFAFDALGLAHRASELFSLDGRDLIRRCRMSSTVEKPRREMLLERITPAARLSWRRPRWAPVHPSARFWLMALPRLAAPVAWQPDKPDRPLLILDVVGPPSLLDRLRRRLSRR